MIIFFLALFALLVFPFPCHTLLEDWSLEEKVGQLFMVAFVGEDVDNTTAVLINDLKIGGVIYYQWANGLRNITQVRKLSETLQNLSRATPLSLPLLIAIDQEGGRVTRLMGEFTSFPGHGSLGIIDDTCSTYVCALAMAKEMRAVGINLNLAPVIDINSNPHNPVIGTRAFGNNSSQVSLHAQAMITGFHDGGIASCCKHFPGHGDVSVDSHINLPIIDKNLQQLEQEELIPFKKVSHITDAMMTGHLFIPAIDPISCSTLSRKVIQLLRNHCLFDGVIITDSLVMGGISGCESAIEERAIQALDAGCDLLLFGGEKLDGIDTVTSISTLMRIRDSILHACSTGRISERQIDQAVTRILRLKKQYPLDSPILLQKKDWKKHRTLSTSLIKKSSHLMTQKSL